jgi:small subunit ribosomal protein S13
MAANDDKMVASYIRIMGTDLVSSATLVYGLAKIKGISYMFANATCVALSLNKLTKIGELSEKEIEKIEEFLSNPDKNLPTWMLNAQNDVQTGKNLHFIAKDLDYNELQLRRRLAKTKSYKALRHKARLPVRGQRTKSNFRRSKTLAAMKAKQGGSRK